MDQGTMKDYLEDLVQQANNLETQFHKLNEVILQLQQQRDTYRDLLIGFRKESTCVDCFVEDSRKDGVEIDNWHISEGHTIEGCPVAKLQRQYFEILGAEYDD
jgi:hypothetical protein